MKLRKLELKDAPRMLEWMHDQTIVENMQTNFMDKTIEDCENFIRSAQYDSENLHMAITDDNDIYMGTVSLKHIMNNTAEFAITVHKTAMGKGYAIFGMNGIINKGFDSLNLKQIYWCVNPINKRAVRFYDKNNFIRISINDGVLDNNTIGNHYSTKQMQDYIWYLIEK